MYRTFNKMSHSHRKGCGYLDQRSQYPMYIKDRMKPNPAISFNFMANFFQSHRSIEIITVPTENKISVTSDYFTFVSIPHVIPNNWWHLVGSSSFGPRT